ncbi:phospho-sugar mutase [Haloplasma contractile]|uniref:Phosphomannomutase Carbohydrate transport protein n=1 Tax=Haloplasma contractile SSD-17B TaxID=1033810 RepID=U2DXI3_9MOLU|nr:phospho-sugar mutase [Haloplasma contractile]ERJ12997.1 Phosphomannomutase Carbohydrate transport protein [Haloplasma contractile SSD-17B]
MSWQEEVKKWKNYENLDRDLKSKLEVMDEKQLEDAFYTNLAFGTGGLRGEVGPGTNRMNIYTIRKANEGFARYLLESVPGVKEQGVVIAYDCRHYSPEFAMESAKVMASNGIKAYIFDSLRPTPELSFAVRHLNAKAGIVVTASHNPPQYNGYKIYDETGCQLVPRLADQVINHVNSIENIFSINVKDEEDLKEAGLINIISKEVDDAYIEQVKTIQINRDLNKQGIKMVFTPLHGTANLPTRRLLKECGYENVYVVEEQAVMDPNFSTVKSPNPEDGEAFELAIKLGDKVDADILMATDPDADRVGLAVKNPNGDYVLLTGNQTGAILMHYILSQREMKNDLPKEGMVYNTIVTSDFGAKIARKYGMTVESTLTGFKFIGEKAAEIENTSKEYVFGYEESYGYLIADFVRDKDSIQAILMCAEAATYYKQQGQTLYDVLFELYEEFGYYRESLSNIKLVGKAGQEKIQTILEDFRSNPPKEVLGHRVIAVEDYSEGIRIEGDIKTKLTLPQSNVLKYFLEDGSWFVLRPSGTEPKIKIYVGVLSDKLKTSDEKNDLIKNYVLNRIENI